MTAENTTSAVELVTNTTSDSNTTAAENTTTAENTTEAEDTTAAVDPTVNTNTIGRSTTAAQPTNTVRTSLRMDGKVADFESSGGADTFKSSLSTGLGLDAEQINIADYYEGSIFVIYDLTPKAGQSLDDLKSISNAAFSGDLDLGYPILDVATQKPGEEATTVVSGGEAQVSASGQTKESYVATLTIDDYKTFLCDKYKTGIDFKKEFETT